MKKKNWIISAVLVLGGLALVSFVSYRTFKEASRNKQIEKEIEVLRQEAEKMREDNKNLEEKIGYFETPEFQEGEAKKKLNFQREDESVVVVKPSPFREVNDNEKEKENVSSQEEDVPNYKKWWNYFFKY